MEKEVCQSVEGLFETTGEMFKPQHNETIISLQHCKLVTQYNFAQRTVYNDQARMAKIMKELDCHKNTSKVMSEQVLSWAKCTEA